MYIIHEGEENQPLDSEFTQWGFFHKNIEWKSSKEWNGDNKVKINLMQDWASPTPKGGFPLQEKDLDMTFVHASWYGAQNDQIRFWKTIE
jgi:hypothetical protein